MKSLIKTLFLRVTFVLAFVFTLIPLIFISMILITLLAILAGFGWFIGKSDIAYNATDNVMGWSFDYGEFLKKLIK